MSRKQLKETQLQNLNKVQQQQEPAHESRIRVGITNALIWESIKLYYKKKSNVNKLQSFFFNFFDSFRMKNLNEETRKKKLRSLRLFRMFSEGKTKKKSLKRVTTKNLENCLTKFFEIFFRFFSLYFSLPDFFSDFLLDFSSPHNIILTSYI